MSDIKLYNGDCFEIMKYLIVKEIQVDAVICDPPYNIFQANWKEYPQLLIEILSYFSTKEKENIVRNPSDSITMYFTPRKDEVLDITRTKRFDLLDAVDAISEVLAKQLNYKGWVE